MQRLSAWWPDSPPAWPSWYSPTLAEQPPFERSSSEQLLRLLAALDDTLSLLMPCAITSTLPDGHPALVPNAAYVKDAEGGWTWGHHSELTPELQAKLEHAVRSRKHAFAYSMKELPGYTGDMGPFSIELVHDKPIFARPRRYSPLEKAAADDKCIELRDAGIIKPCPITKYVSCPTMPAKKDADGNWTDIRYCIDYRAVNEASVPDRYGMHLPEEVFRDLAGKKVFSCLDLRSGFHQLPVHPDSQPMTAFYWHNQIWCYQRLSFGLRNSPAWFQRVLDHEINKAGLSDVARAYIDDVVIASDTVEEHIEHVAKVLDMLHSCGLRAHPDKSVFGAAVISYLGHCVSATGLTPQQAKVAAIREMRAPTNVAELRAQLGFAGYYRCYCPYYSQIAQPLNALLQKDNPWRWGPEEQAAMDRLKDELCTTGKVLRHFDPTRPTIVHTDWAKQGISGVLGQLDEEGQEYLVACVSRSLNKHERQYSSYEGEMLAVVWALKTLRPMLHGIQFTLVTDHQPLKWLMETPDLTGKAARWALSLMDYSFTVRHRPGAKHQNADCLSRFPRDDTTDATGARLDEDQPAAPPPAQYACLLLPSDDLSLEEWYEHPCTGGLAAAAALCPCEPMSSPAAAEYQLLHVTMASEPLSAEQAPVTCAEQLLAGHMGLLTDASAPQSADVPLAEADQITLRALARHWVRQVEATDALLESMWQVHPHHSPVFEGDPDQWGVRFTRRLATAPLPAVFHATAMTEGITLYEPFGGLCAGLEMVLRNGYVVRRYLYSDVDPAARRVAQHRVAELAQRFPRQVHAGAFQDMFTALPQDVRQVFTRQLLAAGALDGSWWFVVAGWECQDLSPAGKGQGLAGRHSRTFWDVVRIVGSLQQLQLERPPAFILENTAMQYNFNSQRVRDHDYPLIKSMIGIPLEMDAASAGSFAHRLRNYWFNVAPAQAVASVFGWVRRPEQLARTLQGWVVQDANRQVAPVERDDQMPFHRVDRRGQPRQLWPTLVAYPQSRAFRPGRPGAIWVKDLQQWDEPSPDERERALGYPTGATAAPGVTRAQRHSITGRCMDAFAMQSLLAISIALHHQRGQVLEALAVMSLVQLPQVGVVAPPPGPVMAVPIGGSGGERIMRRYGWLPGMCVGTDGLGLLEPPIATGYPGGSGWRRLYYSVGSGPVPEQPACEPILPSGQPGPSGPSPPVIAMDGPAMAGPSRPGPNSSVPTMDGPAMAGPTTSGPIPASAEAPQAGAPERVVRSRKDPPEPPPDAQEQLLLLLLTEAEEAPQAEAASGRDIWSDEAVLHYLQHSEFQPGSTRSEQKRIYKRARQYRWQNEALFRLLADSSARRVPQPSERRGIVLEVHEQTGHFGEKRTLSLLATMYWWRGMKEDVLAVVRNCEACDKVRASFNARLPELQPLEIRGLFYRWGVDLCGPFPKSRRGNTYIMICIEHLSKHCEAIPLPSKAAIYTASAFKAQVLGRYGAMAECLTDQGTEFQGEFAQLLEQCFVDHRIASAQHPQSDGLAERAVGTVKRALRKRLQDTKVADQWDEELPWIMLGYNCSVQASTKFSPYQILHGQAPTLPMRLRPRMDQPIDLDDPRMAERELVERAKLIRDMCIMAGENLAIAQHRDTLRYAHVRGGAYQPKLTKFAEGDFVYLRRPSPAGLHMRVRPTIYRIKQLLKAGTVVLEGKCGGTVRAHLSHLAPCHLANIDPTIDVTLQRPEATKACMACRHMDDEADMLLCDNCGDGWHTFCLTPPLVERPEGLWLCPSCEAGGVKVVDVERRMAEQRLQLRPDGPQEVQILNAAQRRRAEREAAKWAAAKELNQRWISKVFREPGTRRARAYKGQLALRGGAQPWHKHLLEVRYEDGDFETMSVGTATKLLLPPGEEPQAAAVVASVVPGPVGLGDMPASWDLSGPEGLLQALQLLMPGTWDNRHVSGLARQVQTAMAAAQAGGQGLQCVETTPAEVQWLLARVDLRDCRRVADPFSGTGAIASELRQAGLSQVLSNDLSRVRSADSHEDALQPGFYQALSQRQGGLDAVVTSPWFSVLDVALPLAVAASRVVACVHVPGHYLASGLEPRYAYLRSLQQQGRLVVLFGLPRGPLGWRCAWLVVFRSSALRAKLMRPGWARGPGLVFTSGHEAPEQSVSRTSRAG